MEEEFFNTDTSGWVDYGPALDVGPQTGGTYDIPDAAQPQNVPWDTPGGVRGNYTGDIIGILKAGVGAWSQVQQTNAMVDYRRYEATQGGVFQQGRYAGQTASGSVQLKGNNNMMLIVLIAGAFLLLRK